MSGLMRAVLSDLADLVYAELFVDPPDLHPLPEEEPLIARSVAKRRNEFVTVRHCARGAMEQLEVGSAPILKGNGASRAGPTAWWGVDARPQGYRGGWWRATRRCGRCIDAEPHDMLPDKVLEAVSLPAERRELAALPSGLHWDDLFFAKEATYKAWFPLTQRWLGFEDAHITFDADGSGTAGTFTSRILVDPAARSGPPLTELAGRWSVADGLALTAIVL